MVCHTMAAQVGAIELVVEAVKSGEISQDKIEKSVERIRSVKSKYLLNPEFKTITSEPGSMFARHTLLASAIYVKSTTLVRHDPKFFPMSINLRKVVLVTPGKLHHGGGVVESGDGDVEDHVLGPTYTSLIEEVNPGYLEVIEIQIHEDIPLSPGSEKIIEEAAAVILATKSAMLSPYQKSFGLSLGKKIGGKLFVIATCEPYDFLEDAEDIKNYITTYEPTVPAFKSAVDVIFGLTKATGILPIGSKVSPHGIQVISGPTPEEIQNFSDLWQQIFPRWPITISRLTKLMQHKYGRYLLHEKGFCLAYLFDDGMAKISAVGVLPEFRNKGLGTALVSQARKELHEVGEVKSFGIGSVFPRFWAGVPFDMLQEHKDFFLHRGMLLFGNKGDGADYLWAFANHQIQQRAISTAISPWM